jgi:hypothetical protein
MTEMSASSLTEEDESWCSQVCQRTITPLRGFAFRTLDIMRTAFGTYIRPVIEHNSIVWNPRHKQLTDLIENLQRNFTKRIPSISRPFVLLKTCFS